jgi:hypothetical protein
MESYSATVKWRIKAAFIGRIVLGGVLGERICMHVFLVQLELKFKARVK